MPKKLEEINENMGEIKDLEGEIWKDIPNYEGHYQVSNLGRIKSLERFRLQNQHCNRKKFPTKILNPHKVHGINYVTFHKNGEKHSLSISRLVRESFDINDDIDIPDLTNETWKDIEGYENRYKISNLGRVKSLSRKGRTQTMLMIHSMNCDYPAVHLNKNQKNKWHKIHRLIALHFIPNPQNLPFVHHIDHNRLNYSIDNLAWVTAKENTNLANEAGKIPRYSNKSKINKKKHKKPAVPKFHSDINITLENEIWATVKDYEECYEISNYGRVKSLERYSFYSNKSVKIEGRLMRPHFMKCNGKYTYLTITLSKSGKVKTCLVHRLVAIHFLGNNQDLPCINHKDGNKSNNHISNLEWITQQDNIKHSIKNGLTKSRGENCHTSKFKEKDILDIRELHKTLSLNKISKIYKVAPGTISKIVSRKHWKHVK